MLLEAIPCNLILKLELPAFQKPMQTLYFHIPIHNSVNPPFERHGLVHFSSSQGVALVLMLFIGPCEVWLSPFPSRMDVGRCTFASSGPRKCLHYPQLSENNGGKARNAIGSVWLSIIVFTLCFLNCFCHI